jgi:hypothetical protein
MSHRLAAVFLLCAVSVPGFDGPAGFEGHWTLNHGESDDLAARIKDAAGSASMSGRPSWASETWVPWSGGFDEPERVSLREMMLATVPEFDTLEIRQQADEIRTVHGEAGSRIFHLKRASSGSSVLTGETVKREARVDGNRLVLESKGKEGEFHETFTPEPSADRLVYVLRLEHKSLKAPLEARLVYERAH